MLKVNDIETDKLVHTNQKKSGVNIPISGMTTEQGKSREVLHDAKMSIVKEEIKFLIYMYLMKRYNR